MTGHEFRLILNQETARIPAERLKKWTEQSVSAIRRQANVSSKIKGKRLRFIAASIKGARKPSRKHVRLCTTSLNLIVDRLDSEAMDTKGLQIASGS